MPGAGKSTLIDRIGKWAESRGIPIGGFITPEVRLGRIRVGFLVKDLLSGRSEVFAHVDFSSPYKVGRYGIKISKFEAVAIPAIENALRKANLILIDEIGRMELLSSKFEKKLHTLIKEVGESDDKLLIASLHRKLVKRFQNTGLVLTITRETQDDAYRRVIGILNSLFPAVNNHSSSSMHNVVR